MDEDIKNTGNIAETCISAGIAITQARSPVENIGRLGDGTPYVILPPDHTIKDLEDLLPTPQRKRGNVMTTTAASFSDYVKRHGSSEFCMIYADIDAEKSAFNLLAILDDHGLDDAGWQNHRCLLSPEKSVEWKRWMQANGKPMSQADFATFLEENIADIVPMPGTTGMPTGAQMLDLALKFELLAEKKLSSSINLQSGGVRFEFIDDEEKNTRTSMEAFRRFSIGVPVFEGSGSAYPVEARLKYRGNQSKVTFWYELIRPDRAFKTAVYESLSQIGEATGFTIINGKVI